MPFDTLPSPDVAHDLDTGPGRLRHLADFIEKLIPEQIDMTDVYTCGTVHCAWGWAETRPEFAVRGLRAYTDYLSAWNAVREHRPTFFGKLSLTQFDYCFGAGDQFDYLIEDDAEEYGPTPEDVARHLRETADQLEAAGLLEVA